MNGGREKVGARAGRDKAIPRGASGDTLRDDWWWGVRWDVARVSTILSQPGIDPQRFTRYFPLRTDAGQADPRALYVRAGVRSISNPTPF